MTATASHFSSAFDSTRIATYAWTESVTEPCGVVQIAHGLAEHASRYERLAEVLNAAGFLVHANDHRGHGRSVISQDDLGNFGLAGFTGLIADAGVRRASCH